MWAFWFSDAAPACFSNLQPAPETSRPLNFRPNRALPSKRTGIARAYLAAAAVLAVGGAGGGAAALRDGTVQKRLRAANFWGWGLRLGRNRGGVAAAATASAQAGAALSRGEGRGTLRVGWTD
jgi:hypothetical protein